MRILQLCHKPPYPSRDGGCLAMAAITEGLLDDGHDVKVLCMSTHKHPFEKEKIPSQLLTSTRMESVFVDVRLKPFDALWNLISDRSYNLARFNSKDFDRRLFSILSKEQFDIIHLESIFCTPYIDTIRKHSKAKVVLRAHNVEHVIWQRLARQTDNPLKRMYLQRLADQLKKEELELLQKMDGIVTITEDDLESIGRMGVNVPMQTVAMGLNVASIEVQPAAEGPLELYHLASMDWQPNLDGVGFFIQEIWPKLHRDVPELSVHFAGRNMPQRFLSQHQPPLHVMGEVPSVTAFALNRQVMVVPLLSGGGMRIKIVEAMALGKVVLSTTIGAEGIPYTDGTDLLIADTPADFIAKLKWLRNHPEQIERIGTAARQLAERHFDLRTVTERLVDFYRAVGV
jgi:glycosyltransferase involved in cell wall biosynthesis